MRWNERCAGGILDSGFCNSVGLDSQQTEKKLEKFLRVFAHPMERHQTLQKSKLSFCVMFCCANCTQNNLTDSTKKIRNICLFWVVCGQEGKNLSIALNLGKSFESLVATTVR